MGCQIFIDQCAGRFSETLSSGHDWAARRVIERFMEFREGVKSGGCGFFNTEKLPCVGINSALLVGSEYQLMVFGYIMVDK